MMYARNRKRPGTAVATFIALALVVEGRAAGAGDWPQILGPERNGVAAAETLATEWPGDGPAQLWRRPLGRGFAGPAVTADTVVVFHRVGGEELVEALDRQSGRPLWTARFPTDYQASIVEDDGPRCVPTIAGDRVIVFGAAGGLRCLRLADGDVLWTKETAEQYGAPEGYFGFGSSPLVDGDRVLVNVGGGRQGAGIVAFDLRTGDEIWKATDAQASYSSPVLAKVGDRDVALFVTRLTAVMLDPTDGTELASVPFGQRGPTVNGANPVVVGDHLFLTASYGIGAAWVKLGPQSLREVWRSDELLSSQYTTPVVGDRGMLFGIHGRQDVGVAELRCVNPATQQVLWSEPDFGYATLIRAGEHLLIAKTDGTVIVAAADARRYRPRASAKLAPSTVRALPALAGGVLYLRDERSLFAYQVGSPVTSNQQGR